MKYNILNQSKTNTKRSTVSGILNYQITNFIRCWHIKLDRVSCLLIYFYSVWDMFVNQRINLSFLTPWTPRMTLRQIPWTKHKRNWKTSELSDKNLHFHTNSAARVTPPFVSEVTVADFIQRSEHARKH